MSGDKAKVFSGYVNFSHLAIIGGHPSPLNTTGSFMNKNYFRECNQYLKNNNMEEIDWNLS